MEENKELLNYYSSKIDDVFFEIWKKVVWQKNLIRDLVIALFSNWHILIEWAPWLAKTLSVDTLAKCLELSFKRIQFTPDLLPSDLLWANVYNPVKNEFSIKKWPIFSNFVLADEINRAPSKVQSALLEAMAEKQITIWDQTFKLDLPFLVLATQNPIEQEWTFSLPEAQLDRFLLKTVVDYPNDKEEIQILKQVDNEEQINIILHKEDVLKIQNLVKEIYVDDNILNYIKDLVLYTRKTDTKISKYLSYWVSPRGSLSLLKWAKVVAFLNKRDFVIPEDVKEVIFPVLRHRISLNYEALASDITSDDIIKIILDNIKL